MATGDGVLYLAGYRWEEETERCYRFHPRGATWLGANDTCADEGAALAVPRDAAEARLLMRVRDARRDEVRATYPTVMPMGFFWDQSWKTLDGAPLAESVRARWFPGWPRQEAKQPWGYMELGGLLVSLGGYLTSPFICEAPVPRSSA